MTIEEMKSLLRQIIATDGRRTSADMPAAWHRILGEYSYLDCQQAVEEHYRESTEWLTPGHIVKRVRAIRKKRLDSVGSWIEPNSGDMRLEDYSGVTRQLTEAIASGRMSKTEYEAYRNSRVPFADWEGRELTTTTPEQLQEQPRTA